MTIRVKRREVFATEVSVESPWVSLVRSVTNPDWFSKGICRGEDPEVFFPPPSQRADKAREICERCPVMRDCGDWATENGIADGIWGGMTHEERRYVRKTVRGIKREQTPQEAEAWDRRRRILEMCQLNTPLTHAEIGERFGVDRRTIDRDMRVLRAKGMLPKYE